MRLPEGGAEAGAGGAWSAPPCTVAAKRQQSCQSTTNSADDTLHNGQLMLPHGEQRKEGGWGVGGVLQPVCGNIKHKIAAPNAVLD